MTTLSADSVRDDLVRRLSGLSAGEVTVESVDVTDEFWAGDDESIRVIVHLSDPAGETWDRDDMQVIRRSMFDAFADAGITSVVRVTIAGGPPVEDEPIPDEEAEEDEE